MKNRIDNIIIKERFEITVWDMIPLFIFTICLSIVFAIGILRFDNKSYYIIYPILAIILFVLITFRLYKSLLFKRIYTNLNKDENMGLLLYILNKLKINTYKNNEYPDVFTLMLPTNIVNEEEEVTVIVKENYILINNRFQNQFSFYLKYNKNRKLLEELISSSIHNKNNKIDISGYKSLD